MKKSLGIIIIIILGVILLAGCGRGRETTMVAEEQVFIDDEQFLSLIVEALDARWTLVEEKEEQGIAIRFDSDSLAAVIRAELDIIESFEGTLGNNRVQELKDQYLEGLRLTEASVQYLERDDDESLLKHIEMFEEGSDLRAMALVAFENEYNLDLNEDRMYSVRETATRAEEALVLEEAVNQMMIGVEFELESEERFEGVVESRNFVLELINTLDVDFYHFDINVILMDDEGNVVGRRLTYVDNWYANESAKFEFRIFDEFDTMELEFEFIAKH